VASVISAGQIAAAALWVTGREGPYHLDPLDPGGETAFGLAIRYHPELAGKLQTITQAEAAQILAAQYWPKGASDLPECLAIPMLAFSVLEGPGQAVMALQRALVVHVDGNIGPQTVHAATLLTTGDLLEAYFGACMDRLHQSQTWARDGTGWERRQLRASLEAQRTTT
jgi:lysozyme family protein